MNGIVNLYKPSNMSSNTACRKVGKILGEKKVGHLGTLDPLAEGVLPVTLGKCTKLFDYYLQKDKAYIADFTFGEETDTLDAEGEIIDKCNLIPKADEIENVLPYFIGEQEQVPPRYSAKKLGGVRAYDLARNNKDFELKPKLIHIYNLKLLKQINNTTFRFLIECSSGTYIRSIARDLAYKVNSLAYMSYLQRTKCGDFCIENSVNFNNITENSVITIDELFRNIDKIEILLQDEYKLFLNSSRVRVMDDTKAGNAVLTYKDKIISFGILDNGYFISKIRFI